MASSCLAQVGVDVAQAVPCKFVFWINLDCFQTALKRCLALILIFLLDCPQCVVSAGVLNPEFNGLGKRGSCFL